MTERHIWLPAPEFAEFVIHALPQDFVTWVQHETASPPVIRFSRGVLRLRPAQEYKSSNTRFATVTAVFVHDDDDNDGERVESNDVDCITFHVRELSDGRINVNVNALPFAAFYCKKLLESVSKCYPDALPRINEGLELRSNPAARPIVMTGSTLITSVPINVMDAATDHVLDVLTPHTVNYKRETLTMGSVVYRLKEFHRGELGEVRLRVLSNDNSEARTEMVIVSAPEPDDELVICELLYRVFQTTPKMSLDENAVEVVNEWVKSTITPAEALAKSHVRYKLLTDALKEIKRSITEMRQRYIDKVVVPLLLDGLIDARIGWGNSDSSINATMRESDRHSFPLAKRKAIVEHYRQDRTRGDVTKKEAWAQSKYAITARTLLKYEREFPE